MTLTAMVERAGDGTWSAAVIGEHSILGTGATREEAIANLREGARPLIAYLKSEGKPLPQNGVEFVSVEVAA